jgi:hypothetical protein
MTASYRQQLPKRDTWLFAASIMWTFIVLAAIIFVLFA